MNKRIEYSDGNDTCRPCGKAIFTKKLYEEVEKARENKEWRREYMAWISELEESKEEDREETATNMLKDSMPISKIMLYSMLPESRILELQKNMTKK